MRKICGPDIEVIVPRKSIDLRLEITYQGIHKYQAISNLSILVSRLCFPPAFTSKIFSTVLCYCIVSSFIWNFICSCKWLSYIFFHCFTVHF